MRLIDADRLKTYYDRTCTSGGKFGEAQLKIIEWVKDIVDSCNTIDAVPVVRCKDCKHREAENGFCKGRGWLMKLVPDDGFCDIGERSDE